jgi:sodium-dependent phosphate transporter
MLIVDEQIVLVVIGFIIAFVLSFGIGANDVANSFGTSVGSKVLTLRQACILATIFEILGAILIGAKVSGTIRKGILNPLEFEGDEITLMLGYVSALTGCCIWLIVATILNLPVSGTHSIVGATIGMAMVSKGYAIIKWAEVARIVASWFISPIVSGVVSLVLFLVVKKFILTAPSPLKAGLRFLPIIYTVTICVNVGGILEASPSSIGFTGLSWWIKLIMVIVLCCAVYFLVWFFLIPFMRKKVEKTLELNRLNKTMENSLEKEKFAPCEQSLEMQIIPEKYYQVCSEFEKKREEDEDAKLPVHVNNENGLVDLFQAINKPVISNAKGKKLNTISTSSLGNSLPYNEPISPHIAKFLSRNRNRERLTSAPSHTEHSDRDSDLDVNLTLRGYLNTVPSPVTFKNLIHHREAKSSVGNTFNKLFHQDSSPEQNDISVEIKDSTKIVKKGRFNIVPGITLNQAGSPSEQEILPSKKDVPNKISCKTETAEIDVEKCETQINKKQKDSYESVDDISHSDPPEAAKIFSFLQILTAIFGAFAHGGNDVSNSIGPLIGLYLIYKDGKILKETTTPIWILLYGGIGISVGLWVLGRRVIKTIGEDLTKITASSGFVIEIASAMTVLGASLLNIPVSTTHCKVGSVVFTGRVRSKESVDWSLFRNIIIAWIVTVPVTGLLAAGCQFCLMKIYPYKI